MYKWAETNKVVKRLSDSAFVPNDQANADWRAFQKWLAEGNTPEAEDPPPAPADLSDVDNLEKAIKAAVLAAAIMSGKTVAEARAAFRQAWNALS